MLGMSCNLPYGEVSKAGAWVEMSALVVAGVFAVKANLLFTESRMLRKIASALRLGKSAEEAIGKRNSLHVVFADKSKGRYTIHGRLLSSAIFLFLNLFDIAETCACVEESEPFVAFRMLLYMPALAAFGTGSAVIANLRGLSRDEAPGGAHRERVRDGFAKCGRDFFLFCTVPLCTLSYGIFTYHMAENYAPQLWMIVFRNVLIGFEIIFVLGVAFISLRKQSEDIGTYAAARIGGKSFTDLSSRQKQRYLRLRSGDRESVVQSLGVAAIVEFVIYVMLMMITPFSFEPLMNQSLLVRYVTLDSLDVGFVLLKLYNDSVVESQLFMILAQHATDESQIAIFDECTQGQKERTGKRALFVV